MELEEEILSDKINLAVLQFKSKNYAECAGIYSELVSKLSRFSEARVIKTRRFHGLSDKPTYGKLVHPKLCGILDQRAATYEKLGSLSLARQDAQKVIALDPVNCKGYLRLGKLHLMENDRISAYKIYQQGVFLICKALERKSFTVPERLWLQLQASYKDLNRCLKQEHGPTNQSKNGAAENMKNAKTEMLVPNCSRGLQGQLDKMLPIKRAISATSVAPKRQKYRRDILEVFPKEIIEAIFALVPFRDLLRAHLVCKWWYQILPTLSRLYRNNFALKHRVTAPEYFQGLKLMKKASEYSFKKSINSLSLWSTLNAQHLGRIIESVISDKSLRLEHLHLIDKSLSMELILQKLEKNGWDYSGLRSVQHLRLGINSSLYNGNVLFEIFPDLESLDIISVDSVSRRANMSLIPSFSDKYHSLISLADSIKSHSSLKRLSLVNHPLLKREHQPTRPGPKTFDPKPLFLSLSLSSLTELKITSYDFTGAAVELQTFLRDTPFLRELYLENNAELSLKKFLLLISSCSPQFKLKKFTLREINQEGSYNIDEVAAEDLEFLSSLSHLDIYGSSITGTGFLKLSAIANKEGYLKSINIGHSSYVQFRNDNFVSASTVLRFSQLFEIAPRIESLFLPELNLDNLSMRLLREDLENTYSNTGLRVNIKQLDLSYCHSIDGIGLMNLFRGRPQTSDETSQINLETLALDGMLFNAETLKLLHKKGYVKNLHNDPFKKKWKCYGKNSMVLEID